MPTHECLLRTRVVDRLPYLVLLAREGFPMAMMRITGQPFIMQEQAPRNKDNTTDY